ncbi:unnamed protein product [Prunus brigantina]
MEMCPWLSLFMRDVPKKPWGTSRAKSWAFRVGTAKYNLASSATSGLSRPRSCAGSLWSEGPEGVTPTGLEVAAGPVAYRTVALSAGLLRLSQAALDKRRGFGRDAYVSLSGWPNRTEGEILTETMPVMVKRSDCSDRVVVMRRWSRCLSQDGRGRLWSVLGRFAGPWDIWGCSAPMIRPNRGVGCAPVLLGRWEQDLATLVGIAPSFLA